MKRELVFISNTKLYKEQGPIFENTLVGYYVQLIDILLTVYPTNLTFVLECDKLESNLYNSISQSLSHYSNLTISNTIPQNENQIIITDDMNIGVMKNMILYLLVLDEDTVINGINVATTLESLIHNINGIFND